MSTMSPPSRFIAVSKLIFVRVLGSKKSRPSTVPA